MNVWMYVCMYVCMYEWMSMCTRCLTSNNFIIISLWAPMFFRLAWMMILRVALCNLAKWRNILVVLYSDGYYKHMYLFIHIHAQVRQQGAKNINKAIAYHTRRMLIRTTRRLRERKNHLKIMNRRVGVHVKLLYDHRSLQLLDMSMIHTHIFKCIYTYILIYILFFFTIHLLIRGAVAVGTRYGFAMVMYIYMYIYVHM